MDTTVFAWTIAATIFAGLQTFIGKVVAHERRDSAFNGIFMYGISGVVGVAWLATMTEVPAAWLAVAAFSFAGGGVHAVGNFFRIEALKHVDSVIFFPINKILGPVLAVLAGVFIFTESLTPTQYIGIFLSLTVPLLLVSQAEHHRQNNLKKGVVYLLFATALSVISLVVSKGAFIYGGDVMFVMFGSQVAGFLVSVTIFKLTRGNFHSAFSMPRRDLWLGVLSGVLGFLSYFTFLQAISGGYLSLVYVIHAHYILIPIVLAVWLHRDHIDARKLFAIVVSSLAVILLYKA